MTALLWCLLLAGAGFEALPQTQPLPTASPYLTRCHSERNKMKRKNLILKNIFTGQQWNILINLIDKLHFNLYASLRGCRHFYRIENYAHSTILFCSLQYRVMPAVYSNHAHNAIMLYSK